jgi:23S rRNA (guanosine2251-2'-O)-methyltransferase
MWIHSYLSTRKQANDPHCRGPALGSAGAAVVNPQISWRILGIGMSKRKGFKHHGDRSRPREQHQNREALRPRPVPDQFEARGPASESGARRPHSGSAHWLYGIHPISEILANKQRIIRRLAATSEARDQLAEPLRNLEKHRAYPIVLETLDRVTLERLLPSGAVHQGVAALVEPLEQPDILEVCDQAASAVSALVLILDQVTDPHNVGAILRSAAAFSAQAVIVTERNAASESGTLAKSASGALEHVPLVPVTNLARAMEQLKEAGFWCMGLAAEASETLADVDLSGRIAIALGAEGAGLRRLTRDKCDRLARLPTQGPIGQLNVSNAAAIALYEVARRRPGLPAGRSSR